MSSAGSDNVFTTTVYEWKIGSYSKEFHIIPIGDVHFDSPGHCRPTFKETVAHIKKLHNEGVEYRLYGMGDYIDQCSDSERSKLARQGKEGLHESTHATLDRAANGAIKEYCDMLEFTKGKWIGFLQGNHYWRFLTGKYQELGKTSDQIIAEKLGGEWLGWASYNIVRLKYAKHTTCFDIFASHGKGSGQLLGSPYNTVNKMKNVFPNADIYMMGHDHSRGVLPETTLEVTLNKKSGNPIVKDKTRLFCRTGSFLKGYEAGEPNYVVRALWSPSSIGHMEIVGKCKRAATSDGKDRITKLTLKGMA
jgi:hypothetical protein